MQYGKIFFLISIFLITLEEIILVLWSWLWLLHILKLSVLLFFIFLFHKTIILYCCLLFFWMQYNSNYCKIYQLHPVKYSQIIILMEIIKSKAVIMTNHFSMNKLSKLKNWISRDDPIFVIIVIKHHQKCVISLYAIKNVSLIIAYIYLLKILIETIISGIESSHHIAT